jgi:hypothetical protein
MVIDHLTYCKSRCISAQRRAGLIDNLYEKSWAQRQLERFPKNRSYVRQRKNKAETGLAKDPFNNHLAPSVQANMIHQEIALRRYN